MIICKSCGCELLPMEDVCSSCGTEHILTRVELDYIYSSLKDARKRRDYAEAYSLCKYLADKGYIAAVREWAAILESGELGTPKLDEAMRYFLIAAEERDAYSAYRYSRLAERTSAEAARFWLIFSAMLGCKEAYLPVAKILDQEGRHADATYYYATLAEYDSQDAIVTLAKRYHDGIFVEKSDEYAKWYMDKLVIPPITAIKLAYRLRGISAKEPPRATLPGKKAIMSHLISIAEKNGYHTALYTLYGMLYDMGEESAVLQLAKILLCGIGVEKNTAEAISLLERSASGGYADAYKMLGDIYIAGEAASRDCDRALFCYRLASEHGGIGAYECLGDIYYEGKVVKEDISAAAKYYEAGASEGSSSCQKKLSGIIAERESLFKRGLAQEGSSPEIAFASFTRALSMGHIPSYSALAKMYLTGRGVKVNRQRAKALLSSAAEAGDTDALYPLGICYMRGIGTRLDFNEGRRLLLKARSLGCEGAEGEIIRALEGKKKKVKNGLYSRAMRLLYLDKFELAKDSLVAASTIGSAKATYTLGCFYEFGLGVKADKDLAYKLYEDAFRGGFRDPRAEYKLIILKILKKKIKKPNERA